MMKTTERPSAEPLLQFSMIWGEKTTAVEVSFVCDPDRAHHPRRFVWSLHVGRGFTYPTRDTDRSEYLADSIDVQPQTLGRGKHLAYDVTHSSNIQ